MKTTTFTLTVPERLKTFVDNQASEGGFASAEDYLLTLLEALHKKQAKARIQHLLLKSLEGGTVEATDEWWEKLFASMPGTTRQRRARQA